MPYWRLFYHLVWTTRNRQPLLTREVEPIIYGFLRAKAIGLEGVVFALNGIADHVHLVVAIPPKIAVAKFVGQVKGVACARFNKEHPDKAKFAWQAEYGAFSFDSKRLPHVIAYVERQKKHHAQGSVIPILERMDDAPVQMIQETGCAYLAQDVWLAEMLSIND